LFIHGKIHFQSSYTLTWMSAQYSDCAGIPLFISDRTGSTSSPRRSKPALTPYSMGTEGSFTAGKVAAAWSWPLISSSAEIKNVMISIPPIHLYGVVLSPKSNFGFYLYLVQEKIVCSTIKIPSV